MSLSLNYPTTRPSLLLDFINTDQIDPRITFSRASSATYFNSNGILTTAATNALRRDYNPSTLAPQGFLVEEQRTNSIRNNTMQGAVAGTPGTFPTNWTFAFNTTTGLTSSVIGVGTESGITYIDLRVNGTASGAGSFDVFFEPVNAVAALTGQTWTGSLYWKLQAGSTTGLSNPIYYFYEYTSAIGFISAQAGSLSFPTNAALNTQRTISTKTLSGGATTAFLRTLIKIDIANGAAIDITLRIGLPQLEQGAFATSVIPTTTTALTRSADVAFTPVGAWFNSAAGTLFAEYIGTNSAQNNVATSLSDGTNDNRMIIRATNSSAQTVFIGVASTVTQWNDVILTALLNTTTKSAFAYATNDIAWVRNGGTVGTDTTATIPTVNRLQLGLDGAGTFPLNGYLRRISYYPVRLANAQLQAITSA